MLLDLKFGLTALALEVGAWSSARLLAEHSDTALASYLVVHALASVLLSLALLPLISQRVAQPRWATLALMAGFTYAIPVLGFVGVLAAFPILARYHGRRQVVDFESLQLPEFDQAQRRESQFRHAGLRTFLSKTAVPVSVRMRAMAALQHVTGRTAAPLLRGALSDPSDEMRLLAYGMLDNLEKRLNRAIGIELNVLEDAAEGSEQALHTAHRLSDLYWEQVYEGLVQGDLRTHAIRESLRYCNLVLQQQPGNAALHLRRGRLLDETGHADEAEQAYVQARALGLPATRVLPYQAQLCFGRRDFAQTQALMQSLDQWSALPRLRPVIDFWNPS